MSLSTSLNAALSGLTAASRAASTVSSNVANAMTEGYARRELDLSPAGRGADIPGVRVVGERRIVDAGLLTERRAADAAVGAAGTRAEVLDKVVDAFGLPGTPGALTSRIAALDASLTEAASRPDSALRLDTVLGDARALADTLTRTAATVQEARAEADAAIATEVERLNAGLAQIAEINRALLRDTSAGRTGNGLLDQRQKILDELSETLPLRTLDRGNGTVAVYAENGAMLLDGGRAEIGFTAVQTPVSPGMTAAGGALSGLTLNGAPVTTGPTGPLSGGRLSALFEARDRILPDAQAGLDALAANLIDRFAAADAASAAPAGAGLFIDLDAPGGPAAGIAQRLAVNPAADPDQGGALWRLRDGLGATAPGPAGDATGLTGLSAALAEPMALSTGGFLGVARDFSGLTAELQSRLGRARDSAETELAYNAGRSAALTDSLALDGVDTDAELQRLLVIERAYAANARVLRAVDEMMQTLLQI